MASPRRVQVANAGGTEISRASLKDHEPVAVRLFFRPAGLGVSHERLFGAMVTALPESIPVQRWHAPSTGLSPFGIIRNLASAFWARSTINHITAGLLTYLAWALPTSRTIVTIHDCSSLSRLVGWRRTLWLWFWNRLPLLRVARVVAVSEATRVELEAFIPELAGRVEVIHNCIPPEFSLTPKSFNEHCPVILHVGTKSNKNLVRVVEAVRGLRCKLRIVGTLDEEQRRALSVNQVSYSNVSRITDAEMLDEYRCCDMVVFASTYEGFGMPIVEAQAIGRPVVVGNVEPLRSVAGQAACLVDPFDPVDIRRGIDELIRNRDLRDSCVLKGLENAAAYSSVTCAARYAALYREVVGTA